MLTTFRSQANAAALAFAAITAADAISTALALATGGGREGNGPVAALMGQLGVVPALSVLSLLEVLLVAAVLSVGIRHSVRTHRLLVAVTIAICIVRSLVVIHNFTLI